MNADPRPHGMSLIAKTATRWLKAFILLFGMYLVVYGHLSPGGGFSGGVVIGCAFILLVLAEGRAAVARTVPTGVVAELDSVGALVFLGVGLVGIGVAGVFFKNFIATPEGAHFRLLSAGTMLISNLGIGLKVGMSLFLVFVMISALHVLERDGVRRMVRRGKGE